jgi:hypothetical protein
LDLKTIRARRAIQARLDEPRLPSNPREIAIEWLRGKIRDGHAGVDVYDPSIFVVAAGRNEKVWAYTCLELVGDVHNRTWQGDGSQRLRAELDSEARVALELDTNGAWMLDEPLASRSLQSTHGRMELLLGGLDPERESSSALRRAYRAFEEHPA